MVWEHFYFSSVKIEERLTRRFAALRFGGDASLITPEGPSWHQGEPCSYAIITPPDCPKDRAIVSAKLLSFKLPL